MIIAFNSLSLAFTSISLSTVARDNFYLSRDKLKLLRDKFELSPETQRQREKRNIAFRDTVPALRSTLNEVLMKKWNLIQNQPLLRQIFKEPPIISYKKGKSLKDMLVRAKI